MCESNNGSGGIDFDVLVIDSSSTDDSQNIARNYNFDLVIIDSDEFNHGGTRNYGFELCSESDVIVYLTQDAILCNKYSIYNLVKSFDDKGVSAAFGRQLPHDNANELATHARLFNYPDASIKKSIDDKSSLGIKTVFISNSFAAYRRDKLSAIGGFPQSTILCEDMYVAAKLIGDGLSVYYCSESVVKHSHNYSIAEEFKRYFDIGVFHKDEPWIKRDYGSAGNEGIKYVKSELDFLKGSPLNLLFRSLCFNFAKLLGMKVGGYYKSLPLPLIKKLSMHKRYWT